MKKVLFLIHDLGEGGAEKVLVNLVNNMDYNKFDVTVMTLFDYGVNRQFLNKNIHYKYWKKKMFRGNSHLMKLLSPTRLHELIIKDIYDIEISYLEGPCARVISGCSRKNIKKVAWIHTQFKNIDAVTKSFRSKREATDCYNRFNKIVFVANTAKIRFTQLLDIKVPIDVKYNTNDTEKILNLADEKIIDDIMCVNKFNIICLGKLEENKGFERMINITKKLILENYNIHLNILGSGALELKLKNLANSLNLNDSITFFGYKSNPYNYIKNSDLFVCSSYSEGFSTATTEALIVGTPVCTVEVSGMQEMLGKNSEYGLIVDNDDKSLYEGIKKLLDNEKLYDKYKKAALYRGKEFSTSKTVKMVENMLSCILENEYDQER